MVFDVRKGIIRDEDGKEISRHTIKKSKKEQLWNGKIYFYDGGCKSYTERFALFGLVRIRYYDYFYDDISPYCFEKKIRNNELSPKILEEVIEADHIAKISKEAKAGLLSALLTPRNIIIAVLIIIAIYWFANGKGGT